GSGMSPSAWTTSARVSGSAVVGVIRFLLAHPHSITDPRFDRRTTGTMTAPAPEPRRMNHPAMSPPLLTPDLPGCGGRIRTRDEDFEVEEVASYEPRGSGEHLYLWVEKRGLAPGYFARAIAQRRGISPGAAGARGLKDRPR